MTNHYISISLDAAESEYHIFSQLMSGFPATAIIGSKLNAFQLSRALKVQLFETHDPSTARKNS